MQNISATYQDISTDMITVLNTAEPSSKTTDSPYARLHNLEEHAHKAAQVYPTGAAGVTVTCGNAAPWTLGAYVEIVPVSTITAIFDIHHVNVEAISAAAVYELVLYAATTEIGRIRFTTIGTPNNITFPNLPIQTPIVAANTQIQAKIMSSTGVANTATISLYYHTY